ncbi:uncharacterized protein LOC132167807 [Corylus avellana]|uniref:uncharacterized protein LOC132167807 n=1 Tax=Corylus avellana TaxID=13451 RepID=UPI001E21B36F|nr:uncharacterized protein LOC132167807 [Corylus avellana]
MARKRLPILQKLSNLLKVSIFVAKMRKPIIPKLIFLKKARKLKKFKLLKHYNYGFLEEYQFSASSTPLFQYHRNQSKSRRLRNIYSMFFHCTCLGSLGAEKGNADYRLESLPALPAIAGQFLEPFDSGDEEDSVDQRAERFIRRFYEEMRMQRQESL